MLYFLHQGSFLLWKTHLPADSERKELRKEELGWSAIACSPKKYVEILWTKKSKQRNKWIWHSPIEWQQNIVYLLVEGNWIRVKRGARGFMGLILVPSTSHDDPRYSISCRPNSQYVTAEKGVYKEMEHSSSEFEKHFLMWLHSLAI